MNLNDLATQLAGQRIPGGCDTCDAYQRFAEEMPGVYMVRIFHDDDCPTLAEMEGNPA